MSARLWLAAAALSLALQTSAAWAAEPVDLNTAPESVLQTLPGIGPKKAAAIVALRAKRPLSRVSQLLEVRGIGKKTLERLKPLVQVSSNEAVPTQARASSPEADSANTGAVKP